MEQPASKDKISSGSKKASKVYIDGGNAENSEKKKEKERTSITMDDPTRNDDDWDESLIPPELIDEVWAETFSPPHSSSSSDEPYEFITDSGTAITLFRKKDKKSFGENEAEDEEEEELKKILSMPDVEGGIPKSVLKGMTIEEIEECLAELDEAMNFILAENIIFERTIGRMEQRDREIEAAMPIFTYKYPWEVEEEEDEDEAQGSVEPYNDSDSDDDELEDCPDGEDGEIDSNYASNVGISSSKDLSKVASEDENEDEDDDNDEDEGESSRSNRRKKQKRKTTKVKKKAKRLNPMIGPDGKIREICEWQDSDDEEFTGEYEAIQPYKEISVSKDKFFDGMPTQDKYAIRMYLRSFGEIAPANYDYMRHKYGKLVNHTYKGGDAVSNEEVEDNVDDDEIREHQKIFDEAEGLGDEDPDFPGFFPRSAKRLPLEYKYKYAEEEDDILVKDITLEQTKAYRKENSIQVLIDTNIDAFELLSSLNDEFTEILKSAYHPLTRKLMAEKILKFRKTLRSKILAEETKITMSLVELQKVRKKVHEQLRSNQEIGFKLQKIDFEQIRIRNNEYTSRIEVAHSELKGLKLLTAGCFQILKEQRQKLNKKIKLHARMIDDIELRETLMTAFQGDLQKYTQILSEVQQRNNFMRKRIRAFKVPNSMEYIRFKAILYGLEEEVASMRKRLRSMELNKISQQLTLESLAKGLPIGSLSGMTEDDFFEEIKKEVDEKGLLSLLTEDELNTVYEETKKKPRQLGQTTTAKNHLWGVGSRGAKGGSKKDLRQFITTPTKIRDTYDPEDDQKSNTEVAKFQNNRSRQKRQTFNRLYENKPATKKDKPLGGRQQICGNIRYRRSARGNIIIDTRDQSKLAFVGKC